MGPVPAIFPLHLDLTLDTANQPGGTGLLARHSADRLTPTWYRLPQVWDRQARYTFQLVLYPSGVFDITYNGLPATQTHAIQEPRDTAWVIEAVPGDSQLSPQHVRFTADLPHRGGGTGIVDDYYLDLRRYLHHLFLPLAYLVIGSSLFLVIGLPISFRLNLLEPLDNLLEGVRQVNAGNLGQTMPVKYHDEIGFLTESFNAMTIELQRETVASRRRGLELEAIARLSSALREAVTPDDMLAILVEETVNVLDAEAGAVLLFENGGLVVAGVQGLPQTQLGQHLYPGNIPCWPVLQAGEMVRSDLVEQGTCAACGLCQALARNRQALIIVPLQATDEILGLLHVAFDQSDELVEERRRPLIAIAEMGGNALQRARTMEMLDQLVQDRTRELAALFDVTTTTTQYLDVQIALERALEKTLEVIDGEAGLIHLLRAEGPALQLAVQRGIVPPQTSGAALWNRVLERGEPVIVQTQAESEILWGAPGEPLNYIGVPIHVRGQVLGVLSVFGPASQSFSVENIILLKGIADHIGAAVESAQLRQRARDTAVQEERRRLARDLHDSVTQSLHSLVLSAETADYLLEQNRTEPLKSSLHRLGESARQALKEMRLLLFELRLAPLEKLNLVEVLQIRLEAVERRAGVEAELVIEGAADWPRVWEGELYCIAMEALNNALRHARATQAGDI